MLGFVLGCVLTGAVWALNTGMVLFTAVIPFFCLQLLLLRVTRRLLLRLIPVYPILALLYGAGYFAIFGKGWDALVALVFGLAAIAPAVGCVLALIVHLRKGRISGQKWLVCALVLLGWFGAWLGQELCLGYWERAVVKAVSFLGCVGIYALMTAAPWGESRSVFQKPDRASLKIAGILALAVFLFLSVGYMVLSPWLDLSAIPEQLRFNDITADNFPVVAAYIIFVNSFLEELFFRGFAFLTLRKHTGSAFAYGFSGVTFALYHVSIMSGWFHPVWFVLFIAGLAAAGMLFDFLDRKGGIWCGWLVHASANLAINFIGMRMFGIL